MIYRTKVFTRFARKNGIADRDLLRAATDVAAGRFDADLGGGVYKQRVARDGGGKSGGFRVILVFKAGSRTFFVYGFAKNAKANLSAVEQAAFRRLADEVLSYDDREIASALDAGALAEVRGGDDDS